MSKDKKSTEKEIMTEYRRRIANCGSSVASTSQLIAEKFGTTPEKVRDIVKKNKPNNVKHGIWHEVVEPDYKGFLKIIVHMYGEQIVWHTKATKAEVKAKIEKLRSRSAAEA